MVTLVTGSTGLLGNNVVRQLLEQGERVRVLVREHHDPRPLSGLDVEVAVGDVRDADSVRQACRDVDVVIHSAGWVHIGWRGSEAARAINVQGTRNVAEAARAAEARLVHVSSVDTIGLRDRDTPSDEDAPPGGKLPCPYVVTKTDAERIVLDMVKEGLEAVIVNPGFMFGPWDWKPSSGRMLLSVAMIWTPIAPHGGCSVCDARDVARGILAAALRGAVGRKYILAGLNISYFRLWKLISRITQGSPIWLSAGPLIRFLGGWGGDVWTKLRGVEPDLNSASVKMSSLFHFYDSGRAVAELGYTNRALEDTIQDTWDWFRAHDYNHLRAFARL